MRTETFEGVELTERWTIDALLKAKKLYTVEKAAKIAKLTVRYLRRLCHAKAVDHHRLLGRYYMTPAEVAALLTPVKKEPRA